MKKILLTISFTLLSSNTYASDFADPEEKHRTSIREEHTLNLGEKGRDRRKARTEKQRRALKCARLKKARSQPPVGKNEAFTYHLLPPEDSATDHENADNSSNTSTQWDVTMTAGGASMHPQTPRSSPAMGLEDVYDPFKASEHALVSLGGANLHYPVAAPAGNARSNLFSPLPVAGFGKSNGKEPEGDGASSTATATSVPAEEEDEDDDDDLQAELNHDMRKMARQMGGLFLNTDLANAEAKARAFQRESLSRSSNSIANGVLERHKIKSPPKPPGFAPRATSVPVGFFPIGNPTDSDSDG